MQIEQVSPGFGEKYLLQTEKFAAEIGNYKKYISQMLKAYSNSSEMEGFADDIVNFSTEVAKVSFRLSQVCLVYYKPQPGCNMYSC